jgi:hypothetical protein
LCHAVPAGNTIPNIGIEIIGYTQRELYHLIKMLSKKVVFIYLELKYDGGIRDVWA